MKSLSFLLRYAYIRSGYFYYYDSSATVRDSEGYYYHSRARSSSNASYSLDISRAKLSPDGTSHDRKGNGKVVRRTENPAPIEFALLSGFIRSFPPCKNLAVALVAFEV